MKQQTHLNSSITFNCLFICFPLNIGLRNGDRIEVSGLVSESVALKIMGLRVECGPIANEAKSSMSSYL